MFTLSSWNWTVGTPLLSDAVAVIETVWETVAPVAGVTIETTGGVKSPAGLLTVTATGADVAGLPEVSVARAVSVCDPLEARVVFQVAENGAVVTAEPRLTLSNLY